MLCVLNLLFRIFKQGKDERYITEVIIVPRCFYLWTNGLSKLWKQTH